MFVSGPTCPGPPSIESNFTREILPGSIYARMTLSDQGSEAARSSAWRMNKIMADSVVTHRGTIYPWHCDHMGHMNVMWYAGKFDEATWHLLASAGLTGKRMREEGIAMVAVEQRIEYKRELLAGDLITIRSWFQEVREKALLFVHEMTNEETGKIAARTLLTGVCLDAKTRKARPLPADVRLQFLPVILTRIMGKTWSTTVLFSSSSP